MFYGQVVLLFIVKHTMIALLALIITVAATVNTASAGEPVTVNMPSSASASILYEPSTGRVLFEKNAHTPLPMASTTKLMTALLACERLPPDAVLTVTAQAVAVEGSSMGLRAGDRLTRHDLLCGLLLSSGNDAANVLALCIGGSFEGFAAMMNERAASLGMTESHFVTPSGLDAQGHGASAYDMALLAEAVLQCEEAASVCAMTSATVNVGSRTITLKNHNKLLWQYAGAVGMKTGYTAKAGRCLVSAATRNGVTLIAVTLNCADDWNEHTTLLNGGFSLMRSMTLTTALPSLTVFGGDVSEVAITTRSQTVAVLDDTTAAVETRVMLPPYIWAPMAVGDVVGTVEYRLQGAVIARADITLVSDVTTQESSFSSRFLALFSAMLRAALTS